MKVGIMQPYFVPYIGYWQLLNAVDKYVIYDDVNYIKRGWINRNNILLNEKSNYISLSLNKVSQNKLINELHVSECEDWKNKILKTIEHTYKKAPYFSMIFPIVVKIIRFDDSVLSIYLENSLRLIAKYLEIETEIILSSSIKKDNDLRGQDKIIEICKKMGADEYYNSIGGIELYRKEDFDSNGIILKFLKSNPIEYQQFGSEFVPNLSIIDVLMFNSIADIKIMLEKYSLY